MWAEAQSAQIIRLGQPLSNAQIAIARSVGVAQPNKIRIMQVDSLPFPENSELRLLAQTNGLLSPNMAGMTLGYGIYIRQGQSSIRLLSHEFRHVYQYEQAGSLAAFITVYLHQLISVGYTDAPLEVDARNHEVENHS